MCHCINIFHNWTKWFADATSYAALESPPFLGWFSSTCQPGEGMWPIVAHARIFSGYLSEYFQEICEEHGRACPLRADMTNWGTCGALGLREVQNFWGKVQTLFRKGGDHAFQIEFGNNYLVCKPNCMFIWTQWQLIYWETGMPRITMGGAARSHELNSEAWEMWHIQIQVANTNTN